MFSFYRCNKIRRYKSKSLRILTETRTLVKCERNKLVNVVFVLNKFYFLFASESRLLRLIVEILNMTPYPTSIKIYYTIPYYIYFLF